MRLILLISFVLTAFLMQAQPNSTVDVLHYQYSISLNDQNDSIDCSAMVILKDSSADHVILLDLTSVRPDGKGMKVKGVWNDEDGSALKFTQGADQLRVIAPSKSENLTLKIVYSGIPSDGLIISKNKFNQRTFFSDNWPNRGHNWLVCHDHPSDKATVDFIVIAPTHYQVVSNGIQTEGTNLNATSKLTHWREEQPLPVKVMGIGVAEFAVAYAGDSRQVPVYSWVFPPDRDKGFADYSRAIDILPFFIDHIAPYPYKKLANVQSRTIFGGMENAGAIFYSEKSVTGNRKTEKLIAHEIAHQWFGNMATEADWAHVWLSEGFATYLSMLYLEYRYGSDTMVATLKKDRARIIDFYKERQTPIVDTMAKNYMDLLNVNSYEKAGWVLHMLHRQLGDSIFWKGLQTYYARFAGRNATTSDFKKVIEDISGRDESQFFRQWLYGAGHPVLHVIRSYTNKTLTVTITQQQPSLFHFPLNMVIRNSSGDFTRGIRIDQQSTTISIPMDNPPDEIILDPQTSLLFEQR